MWLFPLWSPWSSRCDCTLLLFSLRFLLTEGIHTPKACLRLFEDTSPSHLNLLKECSHAAMALEPSLDLAALLERIALHPACLAELDTKTQAETRCPQKLFKVAISMLLNFGEVPLATSAWERAVTLRKDSTRILWPSVQQTPTLWIDGLQDVPIWECGRWPFVASLEQASKEILHEVLAAAPRLMRRAYPYLQHTGTWQSFHLYRGGQWDAALCAEMPRLCHALLPELPTRPDIPFITRNHEEVLIFRSLPGTEVTPHCGATNAQVNLHLTLSGGTGTILRFAGKDHELQDGKALCFQDSYSHKVDHRVSPSSGERISVVVRVMHPEMSLALLGGTRRTDAGNHQEWHVEEALHNEIGRLRQAYRELASHPGLGHDVIGRGNRCPKEL